MTSAGRKKTSHNERDFQRSLVQAINEASPDGILVVDDRSMIVSHNKRLFEIFEVPQAEIEEESGHALPGLNDEPLLSHVTEMVRNPDSFLKRVQELYANPELDDHCEIELKDGRTLERHSSALWGPEHRYLGRVWFFRDVTSRKRLEHTLKEMTHRDPLTGVANRRHFSERAYQEFARARRFGRPLSFIMLDIDYFKRINDKWGHSAGDEVLKNLCDSTAKVLREGDLLGRLGGEEFAVLVPDTDLEGACQLAERLRTHLSRQCVPDGQDMITYTVSAGVAMLLEADVSPDDILRRADKALYAAKGAGRNCVMRQDVEP